MSVYSEVDTTTSEWNSIPFEVDGVQFISKVKQNSEMGISISKVPVRIFQEMNIGAIRSCISNPSLMTREDRKSTRLNSSHIPLSRMPSSA